MKRTTWLCVALLAVCVAPAIANTIWVGGGPGSGPGYGGEFIANTVPGVSAHWLASDGSPSKFETFCIEKDEYLVTGSDNVFNFDISNAAILGGVAGGSPDPLSNATGYLYCEFIKGTLAKYDYANVVSRDQSARDLQDAIWYLEEELGTSPTLTAQAQRFVDLGLQHSTEATCTRVMNLWSMNSSIGGAGGRLNNGRYEYQSLLVCVPAPGAALLVMLGLSIVGWIKRRLA